MSAPVTAILKSTNMTATIAWYRCLGFAVNGVFGGDEPTWCELERDGLVVQFLSGETPWEGPPAFTGALYVHPRSVSAVRDEVGDALTPSWGPEVRPSGTAELGYQDPDGYFVTFTEPAEPGAAT